MPPARLGQPQRGPPPPARRQPGRSGDAGAQPPAGGRLLARPAGADQGPAGGTPRPPRPLRRRALAEPRQTCASASARRWRSATRCSARLAAGRGAPADLDVWDATLAEAAAASLIAAREAAVGELAAPFAEAAAELGLEGGATIEYAPRAEGSAAEIRAGLGERREADLRLGRTSWGPHLDELKIATAGRSLRRYGSQGQQRTALLALLFAERQALLEARQVSPLLLLDDVMSELDPGRRERLVERLAAGGQALITAAAEDSLPAGAMASVVRMPLAVSEAAAA